MISTVIPDIKKILYTTDLSENARYAFGYAAAIANRFDANITVLHVLQNMSPFADSLVMNVIGEKKWEELRKSNQQKVLDTVQERLEKFCDDTNRETPACDFITERVVIEVGNPVEEILRYVKKFDCDLVVMGAHGHGTIGDAMMGSTSRRVLRRCRKPVLVVRLPEKAGA